MTGNDADGGQLLRGPAPVGAAADGESACAYADARELERIVDVAEALGMDPQTVRLALRAEDGDVSADGTLGDDISVVLGRLRGGETTPPR